MTNIRAHQSSLPSLLRDSTVYIMQWHLI